jgi:GNAT superfamily N-acetyltransferase
MNGGRGDDGPGRADRTDRTGVELRVGRPDDAVAVAVTVAEAEAEAAGAVVAFSAVRDGWLQHLYVVPARQGGGIGGVLLRRAMSENPARLRLWAFAANERAIAFYGRAGFAEVLRTDGSRNEEHQPDVQMHWAGDSTRSAATG